MKTKKSPRANLENFSKFFLLLGLTLSLLLVNLAIEYKTSEREINELNGDIILNDDIEETIVVEKDIKILKPKPVPAPQIIEVVKDNKEIIEAVIESTETDETEKIEIDVDDIIEVNEEEEVLNDIPFTIIEDAPVFPGCTGTKKEKKKCFSGMVTKHVNKNFNIDLAQELGLSPNKYRINVIFKIDKSGAVINIRARAPHKRLEREAIRIIKLLPKFTPGKQRGRRVGVNYALPIVFRVSD